MVRICASCLPEYSIAGDVPGSRTNKTKEEKKVGRSDQRNEVNRTRDAFLKMEPPMLPLAGPTPPPSRQPCGSERPFFPSHLRFWRREIRGVRGTYSFGAFRLNPSRQAGVGCKRVRTVVHFPFAPLSLSPGTSRYWQSSSIWCARSFFSL